MVQLPDTGPLVIVGAGGFGRECLDIVEALNTNGARLDFLGFIDDGEVDTDLLAARRARHLGTTDDADAEYSRFLIGIGSGAARRTIDAKLTARGLKALTIIHPSVTCGAVVSIGDGSVLCAGSRLTTNIGIGRHVHVNLNVTIGHDSQIRDYVSIFPGATISGNVSVGEGSTVGTGANILPGMTIGEGCFVGAGAVVNRDVEPGATVAGVPARRIDTPG